MDGFLVTGVLLPIGLGLLGFVEPCAVGAHLTFAGTLAGRSRTAQMASTTLFVAVRTVTMGLLGIAAALAGQSFALTQRSFWLLLGVGYAGLGVLYLTGRAGALMLRIGPGFAVGTGPRNVALLATVLGFGIPACAAPLLFAASGAAVGAGTVGKAFLAMTLFGVALSAPLLGLVAAPRTVEWLQRVAAHGRRLHTLVGWVLVAVGIWSIWFGLFVDPMGWQ